MKKITQFISNVLLSFKVGSLESVSSCSYVLDQLFRHIFKCIWSQLGTFIWAFCTACSLIYISQWECTFNNNQFTLSKSTWIGFILGLSSSCLLSSIYIQGLIQGRWIGWLATPLHQFFCAT